MGKYQTPYHKREFGHSNEYGGAQQGTVEVS
jgi:hypothetical protein